MVKTLVQHEVLRECVRRRTHESKDFGTPIATKTYELPPFAGFPQVRGRLMATTFVNVLIEEHRGFKLMLSVLEAMAARLGRGGEAPPRMIADALDFFETSSEIFASMELRRNSRATLSFSLSYVSYRVIWALTLD